MRKGFLASVAAVAAGTGLAYGQATRAPSAEPAAISASGMPGEITPVVGREPVYLQGGPSEHPGAYQGHPGFGPGGAGMGGGPGCGPGGDCGEGGGSGCGSILGGCGPTGTQVHRAAGGADCFFFDIDLLYYYFRSQPVSGPVLASGPLGTQGRLGIDEGTTVLFGGKPIDFGPHPTLRLNMGWWDSDRRWGFDSSAFLTAQKAEVSMFNAPRTGRIALFRPTTNVLNEPNQQPVFIAEPPVSTAPADSGYGGSAGIYANSRAGGAEANLARSWAYYDKFKFTTLAGFRWFTLNEQLRIDSHTDTGLPVGDPSLIDITDQFTTRNNFYGGQLGFHSEFRHGRWFTDVTGKVAGGFTHMKLNIAGMTRFTNAGVPTEIPFGVYTLEPNVGKFSDKEFSILPSANLKFGYQWTQRLSTFVGYDAMYLSRVVRPGQQIVNLTNPTLTPYNTPAPVNPLIDVNANPGLPQYRPQYPFGRAEPGLKFDTADFFLQGFQFGLSMRY